MLLWFSFQVDAGDREGLLAKMDIEDQEAFLDNNSPDFKKVSFDSFPRNLSDFTLGIALVCRG